MITIPKAHSDARLVSSSRLRKLIVGNEPREEVPRAPADVMSRSCEGGRREAIDRAREAWASEEGERRRPEPLHCDGSVTRCASSTIAAGESGVSTRLLEKSRKRRSTLDAVRAKSKCSSSNNDFQRHALWCPRTRARVRVITSAMIDRSLQHPAAIDTANTYDMLHRQSYQPPFYFFNIFAAGEPLHFSFAWKPQYCVRSSISVSSLSASSKSKPISLTTFSFFAIASA